MLYNFDEFVNEDVNTKVWEDKFKMILNWCKKKFGKSPYHREYPKLIIKRYDVIGSLNVIASFDYDTDNGIDTNPVIVVYIPNYIKGEYIKILKIKHYINSIIHEYTHYLQNVSSSDNYDKHKKRLTKKYDEEEYSWYTKDLKDLFIHDDNPYEREANKDAKEYTEECYNDLFKK